MSYQLANRSICAVSINLLNTSNQNNLVYYILSLPKHGILFDISNGDYIYDVNTRSISSQIIYIPTLNFVGQDSFQIYAKAQTLYNRQIETIYIDYPLPNVTPSVRICSKCPKPVFYSSIQHLDIMGSARTRSMQLSQQLQLGRGKTRFISQNTNVISKNPNPNNSSR